MKKLNFLGWVRRWLYEPWPDKWKVSRIKWWLESFWIMSVKYSAFKNAWDRTITLKGKPAPWINYPAIEFLNLLPLEGKRVFEWGCGSSTLYFVNRGAIIDSVEAKQAWYNRVLSRLYMETASSTIQNWFLYRQPLGETYETRINELGASKYDLILIDGETANNCRFKCAKEAVKNLASDGIIILDNADWCQQAYAYLCGAGLTPIPFMGHAPLVPYTTTTVFFFKNPAMLKQLSARFVSNRYSIGAIKQILE